MGDDGTRQGPLTGYRVVELGTLGPGPFCAMVLSDLGADVIRVDRVAEVRDEWPDPMDTDIMLRGRRSIAVDLKTPEGVEVVLRLAAQADGFIEGFRPGVSERLGIGPDVCIARNERLVYGRMTGYGQDGPMSLVAGHDLNYVALSGALGSFGPHDGPPVMPLNLVGDFGGGGLLLAMAFTSAWLEREKSGLGQVIDCAMVEGAALLMTPMLGSMQVGWWKPERGTNLLDGGAHFYGVYETSDGGFVSFGALEPQFYAHMLDGLGLTGADLPDQNDRPQWPAMRARIEEIVRGRTRAEWEAVYEGRDACFAPVLAPLEAATHPHNVARGAFVEVGGLQQAAPAPRFSRTPGAIQRSGTHPGEHTNEALADWGFSATEIHGLSAAGAVRQS